MNIIIPANKNRFPIVLLIFLLFTILLVLNLVYTNPESLFMNGLFQYIFNGIILAIFLFYTILFFIDFVKTKFDKKASLTISDIGLIDNLSIFSCGKVQWNDINSVELQKSFKVDFLIIKVFDNNKYLIDKNFIQRHILKKYIRKWGSPVVISKKRIEYNLEEIKQIILANKNNLS